jgi:hypothetical protein
LGDHRSGRAPINQPREEYNHWKQTFTPSGFGFSARINNSHDKKPGDVGLFFT